MGTEAEGALDLLVDNLLIDTGVETTKTLMVWIRVILDPRASPAKSRLFSV